MGIFVIPKLAAKRAMTAFGLAEVQNSNGELIYAPVGPDGEAIKVPVARLGKDGQVVVSQEYAPLAYALPTLAAMQVKASFQGKVGNLKQSMERDLLAGMPMEAAAKVQAFKMAAQGKIGEAFMALIMPKVVEFIERKGQAQVGGQTSNEVYVK
jgi:hypothetical protein